MFFLGWCPFKILLQKTADALVYHDGSNEPTLAPQFEWSVRTFKDKIEQSVLLNFRFSRKENYFNK
jgi:hypothetical protein